MHSQAMSVCALQTTTVNSGCKCSMLAIATCKTFLLACAAFTWRIRTNACIQQLAPQVANVAWQSAPRLQSCTLWDE